MIPGGGKWDVAALKPGADRSIQVPKGGMNSKRAFPGSLNLHVEFLIPLMPTAHSQGRGNSGVFLPNRDEIQVLDSFGEPTYLGGGCGGCYCYKDPDTMEVIESLKGKGDCKFTLASLAPLAWQTYDIEYRVEPKPGQRVCKPRVTVYQNGIRIHNNAELRSPVIVPESPTGHLHFQDHGNPVRFRNIWVVPIGSPDAPAAVLPIRVMIVGGQNNHDWKKTTPYLKELLDKAGHFETVVCNAPPAKATQAQWDAWQPKFREFHCIVLDYNGEMWPDRVKRDFVDYIRAGGGALLIHAANNSFGGWKEFEQMVGLLWRGKDFGASVYFDDDGKLVREEAGQGRNMGHGAQYDWMMTVRDASHPITQGMPVHWMHKHDELYHGQRGFRRQHSHPAQRVFRSQGRRHGQERADRLVESLWPRQGRDQPDGPRRRAGLHALRRFPRASLSRVRVAGHRQLHHADPGKLPHGGADQRQPVTLAGEQAGDGPDFGHQAKLGRTKMGLSPSAAPTGTVPNLLFRKPFSAFPSHRENPSKVPSAGVWLAAWK